jgi:hypothetical protein
MNTFRKYLASILAFCWLLLGVPAFAQNPENVEMADQFRADGKIYVVVAVLSVILLGIVIFLFALDRKLSRLEKVAKS